VLLDVQLPELNGFEVVDALPPEVRPGLLFITAFDEFAIRAFDANAIDYVLKPFSSARFTQALGRAVTRLTQGAAGADAHTVASELARVAEETETKPIRRFVARMANKAYFIRPADVDWIDVADNYLRLHVATKTHLVRGNIGAVFPRLDPDQFLRINRGLVVRVEAIATVESVAPAVYQITMRDGTRLTSSRTYAEPIRALLSV